MTFSLLLALALGSEPATPSAAPAADPHQHEESDGSWARTYPEAVELAKKKPNGRILVQLTAPGCGECERQEALLFPAASFTAFMRDKVGVRVGFSSPEGRQMAERFGIPAPPAWIILTTDGLLCGIQGGPTNQGTWFETFVKTELSWAEYRKRLEEEQKNPADLALVYAIAEETYKRGGEDLAESRFLRLVESKAPLAVREKSYAYLASIAMDQKRIVDAEKYLNAVLGMASDEMLRQRAELRLADVEIAKGRRDLAVGRLRQFRKDHPASALGSEADELLRALAAGEGAEEAEPRENEKEKEKK